MNVTVFCASASDIDPVYAKDACRLGEMIGSWGWKLIYGGTDLGLMREVARATILSGGEVTGIIPECIYQRGVMATEIDHLIVAPDMKERKHLLREHADAFIALPGGWGTLEEITEVVTLKQLGEHNKPIVFLNTSGFYDVFLNFLDSITQKGFVSSAYHDLYVFAESVDDAMEYIRTYRHESIVASKY